VSDEILLERAIDRSFAALEAAGGDVARLPAADRAVVVVTTAQGVIDNGGLRAFFEHGFPGEPPYALFVDAYRLAGAVTVADAIEAAARRFPFREPHAQRARRVEWMDQQAASGRPPFADLDDVACGNQDVWRALVRLAGASGGAAT
jgi:hypothetical protein